MCAHNVIFENFYSFGSFINVFNNSKKSKFFYRMLSRRRRFFYSILSTCRRFFTAYSVTVGDFLPHTQ
jgi:hypothetical protein